MDWAHPYLLLLIPPGLALLWWAQRRSDHPMGPRRRRALLAVRGALLVLAALALARPAWQLFTEEQAVIFVLDHSQSQGREGIAAQRERAGRLAERLPHGTQVGFLSAGNSPRVLRQPTIQPAVPAVDETLLQSDGEATDLAAAVNLARGLFPPGTARRLVLLGDGLQTRGDLETAAREAALAGIEIDAVPVAGAARPDVRVVRLRSSRARSHEGATIQLSADVESSLAGAGRIRLFENNVEVESRDLQMEVGREATVTFDRTPEERNLYTYRVRVEGFDGDTVPANDEAMTLVDVRGRPLLLYVEGEPDEAHYLVDAMAREGIRLQTRPPEAIPPSLGELAAYDGIIVSDVPAHRFSEQSMALIRDYVEKLGGGFLMIGGKNSFGVGGYYRTPIEDVLPVKMKAPDTEETYSTALVLVIDRSGSMDGQKIELCKSAAIATAELLSSKDYLGVVAFDSAATWVVPIARVTNKAAVSGRIATINAGGGTHIYPGMTEARDALAGVTAKVKHAIVLTDGQTEGGGYQALAAQMKTDGVTISTVGIGSDADLGVLQSIAAAGGGAFYSTADPAAITRIFTQDAMVHMGKLIREETFTPRLKERGHPMLAGWPLEQSPPLLGYVQTIPKATAQLPLVTDLDDPLLAHWRFGLGKVTAFTSDCKSRWASLWITGWQGYSQFWAQVLREMAREPQGLNMDIRLKQQAERARIVVDLMETPGEFKNDAQVEADVFFVPAGSLGSALKHRTSLQLQQQGPGRYEGAFLPEDPGVYLVRARSGTDMVSAGLVHNLSGETASGQVDRSLLESAASLTGGRVLGDADEQLPAGRQGHARYLELRPWLLRLLLLLFVADLLIRRWENVAGVAEGIAGLWRRTPSPQG